MRIFLFALFTLPIYANAIFGGTTLPSALDQKTSVVKIRPSNYSTNSDECSAIIVSDTALITAAHCTETYEFDQRLTIIDPKTGYTMSDTVARLSRHPKYKIGFENKPSLNQDGTDIAVIQFRQGFNFPHAPVDLDDSEVSSTGEALLVANGFTETRRDSLNLALHVEVQEILKFDSPILSYAAIVAGAGPCEGDSGGALLALRADHYVLIGVQSTKTADACDAQGSRGYAVPIAENHNWLEGLIHPQLR